VSGAFDPPDTVQLPMPADQLGADALQPPGLRPRTSAPVSALRRGLAQQD
jgi:hypothetical protein